MKVLDKILVLGVGNVLLKDDGLGPLVVNNLLEEFQHPAVTFLDGGTLGLDLLAYLDGYKHLIIIDALQLDAKGGEIFYWEGQTLSMFNQQVSIHEVGVEELLQAIGLLEIDLNICIMGVQVEDISWGMELSPPVRKAVPSLKAMVLDKINDILEGKNCPII